MLVKATALTIIEAVVIDRFFMAFILNVLVALHMM
jgi:hypothetical protein